MTLELFMTTRRGDGVVSIRIADDTRRYMSAGWKTSFERSLECLSGDDSIRVIVLEGGDRYFQAGASRDVLTETASIATAAAEGAAVVRALLHLPIPVVAATAGHAIGGGLLLALWCDVVVLGEESLYGANFMALGFTPGMGATYAVPEAFGGPLGRELLYTGRLLTGREIHEARCPLSGAIVQRARVLDHALLRAGEIAAVPRPAIVQLKRHVAAKRLQALDEALRSEESAHAALHADPATASEIRQRYPTALPTTREAP
jgi:polyketide biosynthesis enoyl-CoA hydratase PksI